MSHVARLEVPAAFRVCRSLEPLVDEVVRDTGFAHAKFFVLTNLLRFGGLRTGPASKDLAQRLM